MTTTADSECWLIDLDGVIWLGDDPIPGASEAIRALHDSGRRVAFFTNNSFSTRHEMHEKFARHKIELDDEELLSSSQAAAALVEPGSRAAVLGGAGIIEALELRGVKVLDLDTLDDGDEVDAVFVGLDRQLTFGRLTQACRAITRGASFIATNDDATYPTVDGVLPGGGALVSAVAYATRVKPTVAGKPYPPAVELAHRVLGEVAVLIGDRPETDGAMARGLGARFGMVRSGVTSPGDVVTPTPDLDGADLATVVAQVLGLTRDQLVASSGLHF